MGWTSVALAIISSPPINCESSRSPLHKIRKKNSESHINNRQGKKYECSQIGQIDLLIYLLPFAPLGGA